MYTPKPIAVPIPVAMKVTGKSRTSIYEDLKHRRIAAIKAGRRTLILYESLEAHMAALPAYEPGA